MFTADAPCRCHRIRRVRLRLPPGCLCALAALACLCSAAASAGPVLDRVRQNGGVRCGGAIRPGLAFLAPDGSWHGLKVDLCRAARAVQEPPGRIEFHADAAGSYAVLYGRTLGAGARSACRLG